MLLPPSFLVLLFITSYCQVCVVATSSSQFSNPVRENIKFAVSRKTEKGKEKVALRQVGQQ